MACCSCKEKQSTCEMGNGSPQLKRPSSKQSKQLFTCACSHKQLKTNNNQHVCDKQSTYLACSEAQNKKQSNFCSTNKKEKQNNGGLWAASLIEKAKHQLTSQQKQATYAACCSYKQKNEITNWNYGLLQPQERQNKTNSAGCGGKQNNNNND